MIEQQGTSFSMYNSSNTVDHALRERLIFVQMHIFAGDARDGLGMARTWRRGTRLAVWPCVRRTRVGSR